jgi:putative SOS response-associated peptidase YedK
MCGRFTRKYTWAELHRLLSLQSPPFDIASRYNVAPTQVSPVMDMDHRLTMRKWGLVPRWVEGVSAFKAPINARAETALTNKVFRAALERERAVVPVSGFYEWKVTDAGKQPWYITRADGAPMLLAGLTASRKREGEPALDTFTILTTTPNEFMAKLHDRMPVVLEPESVESWLRRPDPSDLLKPAADVVLQAHPVSTRVNTPKNDDPSLIESFTQAGDGLLFGS